MKKKGWNIFRIILGCYLIFLGAALAFQVNRQNPTDKNLMTIFAAVFILIGIVYTLMSAKEAAGFSFHLKGRNPFRRKNKEALDDITAEIDIDGYIKKEKVLEPVELTPLPSIADAPKRPKREKPKKEEKVQSGDEKSEDSKLPEQNNVQAEEPPAQKAPGDGEIAPKNKEKESGLRGRTKAEDIEEPGEGKTGEEGLSGGGKAGDEEEPGKGKAGDKELSGGGKTGDKELSGGEKTGDEKLPGKGKAGNEELPGPDEAEKLERDYEER